MNSVDCINNAHEQYFARRRPDRRGERERERERESERLGERALLGIRRRKKDESAMNRDDVDVTAQRR